MPLVAPKLAPKLHSSPLVWSQGSVFPQSSLSCLAQTLQHPHPSRTTLTPGAHLGTSTGHVHSEGQEENTCGYNEANLVTHIMTYSMSLRHFNDYICMCITVSNWTVKLLNYTIKRISVLATSSSKFQYLKEQI